MFSTLAQLFWSFCQIGFTSFGGMSMVPLINEQMVTHGWMTATEVSDIVAIAEMTPGPVGLNCATFAGMRVAGVLGAVISVLGTLSPTFTLCALAAVFFQKFKNSKALAFIMEGVRPVSIGIIAAVMISLSMTNYSVQGTVFPGAVCIGLLAALTVVCSKSHRSKRLAGSGAVQSVTRKRDGCVI